MGRVTKDHWFVNGNDLEMSLWFLYCKIGMVSHKDKVYCRLTVIDEEKKEMIFVMNSMEEAVDFVENYIYTCHDLTEVSSVFSNLVEENKKGRSR